MLDERLYVRTIPRTGQDRKLVYLARQSQTGTVGQEYTQMHSAGQKPTVSYNAVCYSTHNKRATAYRQTNTQTNKQERKKDRYTTTVNNYIMPENQNTKDRHNEQNQSRSRSENKGKSGNRDESRENMPKYATYKRHNRRQTNKQTKVNHVTNGNPKMPPRGQYSQPMLAQESHPRLIPEGDPTRQEADRAMPDRCTIETQRHPQHQRHVYRTT